jgi:hypothetical protein
MSGGLVVDRRETMLVQFVSNSFPSIEDEKGCAQKRHEITNERPVWMKPGFAATERPITCGIKDTPRNTPA